MLLWFGPIFPLNIIYSIINYFTAILIIIYFAKRYKIETKFLILLILTLLTPFFMNGVLIDWYFVPDQSKYLGVVTKIRNLNFSELNNWIAIPTITVPSLILSLTPIPFIESFNGLGFANRLLFSLLVIFLINKKTPQIFIYFLILSPTLLFYTSTGLKETIVIILSILCFFAIIEKRYFLFFFPFIIFFLCKWQNASIILFMYIFYYYYYNYFIIKKKKLIINLFFLILVFIFLLFLIDNFLIDEINEIRSNLFIENGGNKLDYKKINSIITFIPYLPFSIIRFIVSPFPDISSLFKMFLLIENIIVMFFLILYYYKFFKIDFKKASYWLFTLIIFLSMYSTVTFNHGTISRWKLSFLISFLFAVIYLTKKKVKNE